MGSVTPTYDGNGAPTCDGGFKYGYDAESRLTGISSLATYGSCASTPTTVASYTYDAQGRRKSKTVGSSTTLYVTDADNREVLEYDGTSGALTKTPYQPFGENPALASNGYFYTRRRLDPETAGSCRRISGADLAMQGA